MACDQCALRRDLAQGSFEECGSGNVSPKNMIDVGQVGCFLNFIVLYQVIFQI